MERSERQLPGQQTQSQQPQQQQQQQQHGQQSQQQQQPTAVVIVQQPIVVGHGTFARGQPFMRRGVKLNNGMQFGANSISFLGVFGSVLTFMGLIFAIVGINVFVGIIFMIIGGGSLAACFKFCHKAKKDYDALPQDHPDRVIYSTPVFRPHRGGGAFQLPVGTQILAPSSAHGGGQFHFPQGTQFLEPSTVVQPGGINPRGSIILPQHPGIVTPTTPPGQIPPAEDKPPSYEEVCKAGRSQ